MSQMRTHLHIAHEKQNETMEAINDTLKFGQVKGVLRAYKIYGCEWWVPGKKDPDDYKAWVRGQYTAAVEESVEILDCLLRRWKAGVQRIPPAYVTEANASMLRGGATCVFCHLRELDKNPVGSYFHIRPSLLSIRCCAKRLSRLLVYDF